MSFPNRNNCKTDIKFCPLKNSISKNFLKQHFFYLAILLNNIRFVSYTRRLFQKIIELKNYVKNLLKINYVEFRISTCSRALSLILQKLYNSNFCFYQQQSSLLYGASCISSTAPLAKEVSTAINFPYYCQTIKLVVGAMAEPFHN